MIDQRIKMAEAFVEEEFRKHPHHSFGDWTVMQDHSMRVRDLALQIGEGMHADTFVIEIVALLHDIGKTYEADDATLHVHHEDFNLLVSEKFLDALGLTEEQLRKIKNLIVHKDSGKEAQIIEDADALAFYADRRLYMLFIDWAREMNLEKSIQKKLDKFARLHFDVSRQLGAGWYEQMKKDWGL